ncbi:DNA excision repair protein ERCC-6 [Phytophthora pseudosyringae]|uniref:DNA excision repair protein ERCC-6 n=1 Tax=Phytophthora pseudosyringae TaxID=221518 RepID=A0A8T1VCP9_9STRA|nr:DNA excision repair protein ERCC-6 [Phytophthora pseudosyringae]
MATAPLLAVALVFRSRPGFDGIDHVIDAVSTYADSSVELPLHRACNRGFVALLDRIWASSFTLSLMEAARGNDVEVVRWLFAHFPGCGVRGGGRGGAGNADGGLILATKTLYMRRLLAMRTSCGGCTKQRTMKTGTTSGLRGLLLLRGRGVGAVA